MDKLFEINVPDPTQVYSAIKRIVDLEKRKPVRASSYSIAANDSSQNSKNSADYVIPAGSITANTVFTEALSKLPAYGGRIILLEGTFVVSGVTNLPTGVTIEGQGKSTFLLASNSIPSNIPIFRTTGANHIGLTIANLKMSGGSTKSPLIELVNTSNSIVEGVLVDNTSSAILISGGKRNHVYGCSLGNNCAKGVHLAGTENNLIESNDFDNSGTSVLLESGATKNKVIHNNIDLSKSPVVNNGTLNKVFNTSDIRYTFLSDQDPDPLKGEDGDIWM